MNHKCCKSYRIVLTCLLALAIWLSGGAQASAETVYYQEMSGQYGQTTARNMLALVNDFRTGSEAWYWNEENTQQIYASGLSPLKYDYNLEKVAMLRAVEIAVKFSHTRPNGQSWSTAYEECGYGFCYAKGENIAYGYTTYSSVFNAWREDNDPYSGQGHRRNMLSSKFGAIGIGHFYYNGYHYWVQEFSSGSQNETATTANDSAATVMVSTQEGQGTPYVLINNNSFADDALLGNASDQADANNDGMLSESELASVTTITGSFSSDVGLEYFTNLEVLDCSSGSLTSLDISNNTALTYLDCSANQLTTLDVSNVPALQEAVLYGEKILGRAMDEKVKSTICYQSESAILITDSDVEIVTGVENAPIIMYSAAAALDGKIGLVFNVKLPNPVKDNAGESYAIITRDGTQYRREMTDIVASGRIGAEGVYRIALYMPPACYADDVKIEFYQGTKRITLTGTSGTDYTNTGVTYSVKRYIDYIKANGSDGSKALVTAMEDYCGAAQIFFGYENGNTPILSGALGSVKQSDLQGYVSQRQGTIPDKVKGFNFTASFETDNAMKLYITFEDGKKPSGYQYFIDGEPATLYGSKTNGYYLRVRYVPAALLDQRHDFSVSDGTDTYTISCSILTYSYATAFKGEENIANLCKALYLYCKAAKTYFNIPY
ncbi:MAG: leucine-rich repeat domain-containing protein [Lachnospiraceae bacterium]|nr:leucine-rich repeat domain-containing protein [Lachnospiraceae bacterium]